MHKLYEYAEVIMAEPNKLPEFHKIMCETLEAMMVCCPDVVKAAMYKTHVLAYGEHFDEAMAKEAVAEMVNSDGTHGAHWTIEQTNQYAAQCGIRHNVDFFYVMNMLWSDFGSTLGGDASLYARMAKAYICDPDAAEGKALKLYMAGR